MLKQKELSYLLDSLKYGGSNIISQNERFAVTKPRNTWDMNYQLHDKEEELTYLIDIDDVQAAYYDDYEGVLYSDLVNMEVEEIKEVAWKVEKLIIEY